MEVRCDKCKHSYWLNGYMCRLEHYEFNIARGGCSDWEPKVAREPKHVHPGVIVQDELYNCNIRPRTFARQIGVKYKDLERFLHGEANLDEVLAGKIEAALNLSAQCLMRQQKLYSEGV